jgi:hypothetical protein|tara:strand:+ start:2726 stop:3346 length:621 start_codon:yes stop_codon:yes gene_type:complete
MEKFVFEIPNFIPSDICESIIQRFENDNRKVEGSFTYPVGDGFVTRFKNNFELPNTDFTGWEDVNALFIDYTRKSYIEYINHLKHTFDGYGDPKYPIYERELDYNHLSCSGFPIQRLGEGDVYDWHHDGDVSKTFFIQIIFYLNTLQENQGGCTEFIDGRKVRPEVGKVLMYPCSWTFPHKGGEILDGYKYICTTMVSTQTPHYPH